MKGFLFDENLPQRIQFSPKLPVISISDVGASPTDSEVWEFARKRALVIVSKDADFSDRIIIQRPPPWVVHLHFGIFGRKIFTRCLAEFGPKSKRF